jgi:Raf kinase inhibitor-like YbhB/YbcL family protein
MTLTLTSPAFAHGGAIPKRFTCDGADDAPPLAWTGAPAGTNSFALIVDDPDAPDPAAPRRVWVHWVVWDLPATTPGLSEGGALPPGARAGDNDGGGVGWEGPCPPIGCHRYFFKLYALDKTLGDLEQPTKQQLEQAMEGHILARSELVGTYEKAKQPMS